MTVPFLDLRAGYLELKSEIDAAVAAVLDSGRYVLGAETEAFECEYAAYVDAAHCVGVASGLDALQLSLLALGVGSGDEVIVPSNTYIATWLAVSHCGAIVVPVEPDPDSCNLDPTAIEAAITPRTKAILPVHLYGQPADMESIIPIAQRHGLRVVEDAAQAHGARSRGHRIGAHGDAVAWSFYPSKNLGAMGDGGAITTNDPAIAARLRLLRNYGSGARYYNEIRGFNSRLDPVQAAVLRIKLRHLDEWNARRTRIAALYDAGLADTDLTLPSIPDTDDAAWHLYVVRSTTPDQIAAQLKSRGIESQRHYPIPPHRQQAYADVTFNPQPLAECLAEEVLSLPIGPHQSIEQSQQVIDALRSIADQGS